MKCIYQVGNNGGTVYTVRVYRDARTDVFAGSESDIQVGKRETTKEKEKKIKQEQMNDAVRCRE